MISGEQVKGSQLWVGTGLQAPEPPQTPYVLLVFLPFH